MSIRLHRASGAASALGAALVWAFVPKCPLCIAAYLAALGIGAESAAAVAPLLRPIALVLLGSAALVAAIAIARRTRKRCCQ